LLEAIETFAKMDFLLFLGNIFLVIFSTAKAAAKTNMQNNLFHFGEILRIPTFHIPTVFCPAVKYSTTDVSDVNSGKISQCSRCECKSGPSPTSRFIVPY
jgi:hypothetical protein